MNQTQALTTGSSVDFVKFLEDHPDFCAEASAALTEAAKGCRERLGKCEITLKLALEPKKGGEVVQITPHDPQVKLAKSEWASKPYYVTEHGQLLRDHPGQMGLFDGSDDDEPVLSHGGEPSNLE